MTPQAVADFAYLHMTDDEGIPIEPAPHHWLWLNLMCDPYIEKLLIIAPPESAKTSWLLAYAATDIAFYPEWPRILAAVSGPVAKKRSIALKNLMLSQAFQETFPDVLPARGMKWTEEEWSVAPNAKPRPGRLHPTLFACGTGGPVIGSRARLVLGDDILDYENTFTQHQRDKVEAWIHSSLISRKMSRVGRVRMIGNAWHHDDPYQRLLKSEGWVYCHMGLLAETDAVYATIHYPDGFQGQMLGEPLAQERLD